MNKNLIVIFNLCVLLYPTLSSATVLTLYDTSLQNLPSDQPWLSYFSTGSANVKTAPKGVSLHSDNSEKVGFSNYPAIPFGFKNANFPMLNSSTGFTVSFSMQLDEESHSNENRAGFSVIVLDENKKGVELGFWQDSIWSQSATPLFQAKDESVNFDSKTSMVSYDLTFLGDNYFLTGDDTSLLMGSLKDYSAFDGNPFGLPYSLSNYLFFGDDTSNASAQVSIGQISLTSVPIPPSIGFMSLSLLGLLQCKRK